jgi:hypothetical protein
MKRSDYRLPKPIRDKIQKRIETQLYIEMALINVSNNVETIKRGHIMFTNPYNKSNYGLN